MSSNINRATILGNITRDIEARTTPNGKLVASFSVATNEQWTSADGQKQTKTEYHNIVAWSKLAEICSQYLRKGSKVYVEGSISTREYTTQDGQKRTRTEITAENLIMLDPKNTQRPVTQTDVANLAQAPQIEEIRLEDIPF